MNTNQLKTYAPKARLKFIEAIKTKLRTLGIEDGKIAEVESSGDFIFIQKQPFPKSIESARQQIIQKIEKLDFEQVLEQYAYTWFNRLCAIRFMELHDGYLEHGYRVLSHSQRDQGLEFLDSAVEVAEYFGLDTKEIIDLKLEHKDEQLYRQLLLAQCNQLYEAMPFLFDPIDSVTSLLLPDDLTRSDSIIMDLVQQVEEDSWQQVEIIGWLYQFYISEIKGEIDKRLKGKGGSKVVSVDELPAKTQLFTPNWIVKYMVQNSLGRYWLQTYPDTVVTIDGEEKLLKEVLEYYIEPAEQEDSVNAQLAEITPKSIEPESIKVIDPASGSGHILVEAYDLLKLIYQSQGHRARDIPKLILENNIFGLDIDDRAEQLTGFALMMKARQDDRGIFGRGIHLNICAFQNSDELDADQLWQALNLNKAWQAGSHVDMFGQAQADLGAGETDPRYTLIQEIIVKFKDAKAFGSLLSVDNKHEATLFDLKNTLSDLVVNGDSLQKGSAEKLLPIVEQAWILSQRYEIAVANPPYLGIALPEKIKHYAKKEKYKAPSDLMTMFIEKLLFLLSENGLSSSITLDSWMYLSSYEKLRFFLLEKVKIDSLVHIGWNCFPDVHTYLRGVAVTFQKCKTLSNGKYINLSNVPATFNKENLFLSYKATGESCFEKKQSDFENIPSSPIAYWISDNVINSFKQKKLNDIGQAYSGLQTGNNDVFLKFWYEVNYSNIYYKGRDLESFNLSGKSWIPHKKGGDFRKWYGNSEYILNWEDNGSLIKSSKSARPQNIQHWFKEGVTWSHTSSSSFSARILENFFTFNVEGPTYFSNEENTNEILGLLNSKISFYFMQLMNPTLHFLVGNIINIPLPPKRLDKEKIDAVSRLIQLSKSDWDYFEQSWDFKRSSLLLAENKKSSLSKTYNEARLSWKKMTDEVQILEQENNSFLLDAYNLNDEMTSEVTLKEITLTSNPYYRYSGEATEELLEQRLQSDTIAELISYAIGCMMGRYSLDREGLVYSHEGNVGFDELVVEGAYKTFPADDDGILPLLDEERFPDDVYSRFEQFIETAWDKETLQQNLDFIAESLRLYNIKPKNGESSAETIRRYLSNHFYKDHHLSNTKGYKNRPIYWLFSSGKQKAFECLVYMHRFNDTTLAKMRTQYVLPLMGQLTARAQFLSDADKDISLSPAEKTKYAKEADNLHKKLNELKDFDAELKHYIEQKISIDLDDGVKVNYGKFSKLLAEVKKVTGNKE
ncbi:SAM-dependent methyltransferase [Acinetobacter sp. SWBY1]|nr:SAM-dependent methyltransferase [Acinetobacter sp. SWBY1]